MDKGMEESILRPTCDARDQSLALGEAGGVDQGGGWRPIDSAPKDGTPMDVWGPAYGRYTDVYWGKPTHSCGEHGRYCDSDWHSLRPGWVDGTFNEIVGRNRPGFTHWMPLPEPPVT